jgi:hypothetical protein
MKQINRLKGDEFKELAFKHKGELLKIIDAGDVIIVRGLYDPKALRALRDRAFAWGQSTPASWHPCVDGCPDYHRLHNNYPKAHVRQKMHAFYWHGFYSENLDLMKQFEDIFHIKNRLAGEPPGSFLTNKPSEGPIARVNIHHYPVGGGYQAQHIDPVAPFALIQTLILASQFGVDYKSGGLYADPEGTGRFYIDPYTQLGDMVVLSPGIRHGVAEIDPERDYAWQENSGRWMILPIIINSDVDRAAAKPQQV